jgi:hypothetical protein
MLLWLYTYASSVSSIFKRMLQMLHLNVLKLDLGKHMLQWSRWLVDSSLSQLSVDATGALSWVTVRAPEARRCLRGAPP